MKITNPSNNAIENVSIFGVRYSIAAEGTLENVPETHARYWQENLHKFLILRKDKLEEKKEEEVVEVPKPKVEEVVLTPREEVVAELGEEKVQEIEETAEIGKQEDAPVVVEKSKVKSKK